MMISEDFTRILLEHKIKEMKLMQYSNKILFEDTDCLITRFFMEFLKDENMEKNAELAESIAALNSYDLVLYLSPDVEWVQDGDRSEIIAADRDSFGNKIRELYDKFGFKSVVISGNYLERYEKAIEYIDKMLFVDK